MKLRRAKAKIEVPDLYKKGEIFVELFNNEGHFYPERIELPNGVGLELETLTNSREVLNYFSQPF